jgi:hypothetical protein
MRRMFILKSIVEKRKWLKTLHNVDRKVIQPEDEIARGRGMTKQNERDKPIFFSRECATRLELFVVDLKVLKIKFRFFRTTCIFGNAVVVVDRGRIIPAFQRFLLPASSGCS